MTAGEPAAEDSSWLPAGCGESGSGLASSEDGSSGLDPLDLRVERLDGVDEGEDMSLVVDHADFFEQNTRTLKNEEATKAQAETNENSQAKDGGKMKPRERNLRKSESRNLYCLLHFSKDQNGNLCSRLFSLLFSG